MWKVRSLAHLFPGRGVRQGDPLFSILLNSVIESILADLVPQIGFDLSDNRISHLAYVEDVNLVSATSLGLQLQINRFKDLAFRKEPKVIPYRLSVKIDNMALEFVSHDSPVSYMGIDFNPTGIVPVDLKSISSQYLKNLKDLPVKPQQKLYRE